MSSKDLDRKSRVESDEERKYRLQFLNGVWKRATRAPDEQDVRKGEKTSTAIHTLIWRLPWRRAIVFQISSIYNEQTKSWIFMLYGTQSDKDSDSFKEYPECSEVSSAVERATNWINERIRL